MVDQKILKDQADYKKLHPKMPYLDAQYQQFLFEKYAEYVPKNQKEGAIKNQDTQTHTEQPKYNRQITQ